MYNEELENLINYALEDGQLTEKERNILNKKAEAFGIDMDEFEMVLNARLNAKQKKIQQDVKPIENKTDKIGGIKKCPACGAILQSFQTQCPNCGHDITNISANSSVKTLSERLSQVIIECEKIDFSDKSMLGKMSGTNLADEIESRKHQEIKKRQGEIITNFPIPNTRDDILELLHFIAPKVKAGMRSDVNIMAWRSKYNEVISRAEFAFSKDQKMMSEIEKFKSQYHSSKFALFISWFSSLSPKAKKGLIAGTLVVCFFVFMAIMLGGMSTSHSQNVDKEKARLEQILQECKNAVAGKDYVNAMVLAQELVWGYSDSWSSTDTNELKETWKEKREGMIEIIEKQNSNANK